MDVPENNRQAPMPSLLDSLNYIDDEEISLGEDLSKQHENSSDNQRRTLNTTDAAEYDDHAVIYDGNYSENDDDDFINELNKAYAKENTSCGGGDSSASFDDEEAESDLNLDEAIDHAKSERRQLLLDEDAFKCCSEPNTPSGRLSPALVVRASPPRVAPRGTHANNSFVYDVNLYNNQNVFMLDMSKEEFDKQLRLKKKKKNSKSRRDPSTDNTHSSSSSLNNDDAPNELEPLIIEEEEDDDDEQGQRVSKATGPKQQISANESKMYDYELSEQAFSSSSSASNQCSELSPSNSTIVKSSSSCSSQLACEQRVTTADNVSSLQNDRDRSSSRSSSTSSVSALVDFQEEQKLAAIEVMIFFRKPLCFRAE